MNRRARLVAAAFAIALAAGASSSRAEAPTILPPHTVSPAAGDRLGDGAIHFTWRDTSDPTGRQLRYEVEVDEVVAGNRFARRLAQATGGSGSVGVTLSGLPWGATTWRVRAVDASGLASEWSAFADFEVLAPTTPDGGAASRHIPPPSGCSATGLPSLSTPMFGLLAAAALLLLRRRTL